MQLIFLSKVIIDSENINKFVDDISIEELIKEDAIKYKKLIATLNKYEIDENTFKALINTKQVKNYLKVYINDLVDSIINDKKMNFNNENIKEFFIDNIDELVIEIEKQDIIIKESYKIKFINNIDLILQDVNLDIDLINKILKDEIFKYDIIKTIYNKNTLNILIYIFLITTLLIILIKRNIISIFLHIGIPFMISGITLITSSFFINKMLIFNEDLIEILSKQINNIETILINKGILLIILGLLFLLVGLIVKYMNYEEEKDSF